LFVVLVAPQLVAQDRSGANREQTHYIVKALSTLGGMQGVGEAITERGWISGAANLEGDTTQHAALWRDLRITDLGTLGGPNSRVVGGVKNNHGLVAGGSETADPDPLGETVCTTFVFGFSGQPLICLGFVWQDGVMTALPTLGGNNGFALGGVNNRGQIAGFAENSTRDPACPSPQRLDFEAVVWGPRSGQIQELPPYAGDTVGFAQEINDHGQAVGATGLCSAFSTAITRAVLWQDGSAIDLGNLGSQLFNFAITINERGQVAGAAGVTGDATWHAFFWDNGVMRDLGVLAGDVMSQSNGMNNKGQVVGTSCVDIQFSNCHAFIWQNGVMTDLNDLIPPNSLQGIHLAIANDINDRGEIVGATFTNNGTNGVFADGPGFVLFPCDEIHQDLEGCETWR
jgi:probable HAF family extracellular repeat protein